MDTVVVSTKELGTVEEPADNSEDVSDDVISVTDSVDDVGGNADVSVGSGVDSGS